VKWNNVHADVVFSYGGKISSLIESLGVDHKKIIEIPTGIDPAWIVRALPERSNNEIQFCFIGRNERRKGIHELHEAIKKMPESGFQFHFIGPIPSSTQLKRGYVKYHGALRGAEQIQAILDQCQVLVTPSHSEGMPNVIMEGMARGLAIVATPVGAVESVVDETNGWLIEPGNVNSLTQTLSTIIEMKTEEIQHKQQASLERIARFTWDNIAHRTIDSIGKFSANH
jgi:glycosyltransferase involved in cell wall biosynthesis